jgi:hypothetical protein
MAADDKFVDDGEFKHGDEEFLGDFVVFVDQRKKLFGAVQKFDVKVDDGDEEFIDPKVAHFDMIDEGEGSFENSVDKDEEFGSDED